MRKMNKWMDGRLFLKGQHIFSPEGEGEIIDTIRDKIVVKLDNGETQTFPSIQLEDKNSAGPHVAVQFNLSEIAKSQANNKSQH